MSAPEGLSSRGVALWESFGFDPASASGVLALEAARCADRLDELDVRVRGGDAVALVEARQQQNVLRQLLVTLGDAAPASAVGVVAAPQSVTDEFTARRRGRGA